MYKVELKAKLQESFMNEKRAESFGFYLGSFEKDDFYWADSSLKRRIRIRREKQSHPQGSKLFQIRVTFRDIENIESKQIRPNAEFTISDQSEFETLLQAQGFTLQERKIQYTRSWIFENVTIDISNIKHVGDLIQVSLMSESDNSQVVKNYEEKLYRIMEMCGVTREEVSSDCYQEKESSCCLGFDQ